MPYYPDEIVNEVRDANDIVDVVSQYVHLKQQGGRYFGLCPFHNEKTPSFSVTRDKQLFYCFGCGAGGDVLKFVQRYDNMTFPEALQSLADRAGISLPKQELSKEQRARADRRSQLLEVNKEAGKYFYRLMRSERGRQAYDYFKERGLSKEVMQQFGLGYSDKHSDDLYRYLRQQGYRDDLLKDSGLVTIDERRGGRDKFWNRAMFPIMDANAKVIAFGGRVMGDGEPKYLNSPETDIFNKSRTLYGLHLAKRTRQKFFILCEGYMDVIALHQAGFDNAVASLGTAFTEGHAALVRRYVSAVCLSYDSDGAGRKAALRAIPILREAGISCKVINMQPHKDPDEFIKALGADAYQERIDQAENSFLYRIRMLEEDFELGDPGGKSRFAEAVAERILEFPEEIERNNYIDAIAGRYGMSVDGLREMVRHAAAKGIQGTPRQARAPAQMKRREDIRRTRGDLKSQKLLLRWLTEEPALFGTVSKYIGTEDFDEGVYAVVAQEVFRQLAENGEVRPAVIISHFSSDEEVQEASSVFFEEVQGMEGDEEERQKALREIILFMRRERLAKLSESLDSSDALGYQRLIDEKKKLEELEEEIWQRKM